MTISMQELFESFRWKVFQALERLSAKRSPAVSRFFSLADEHAPAQAAMWLYVSTIGELNAVSPALDWLMQQRPELVPVIITDHPHYADAYRARYPQARICISRGYSPDAARLARRYPPELLVVAEIPCLPSDAPCRFSYAFVRQASEAGAKLALINGWLYHYGTAARLDALERRWFQRNYLRRFDALCVQDEATRQHLLERGSHVERVHVTGNMKFDAMNRSDWRVEQARSPRMLGSLLQAGRPVVVAGCVTDAAEQDLVLNAFTQLKASHSDALLVLAPRHPENAAAMQSLNQVLQRYTLKVQMRTHLADDPLPADTDCLVLDTVGELRDFYTAASVAHVGVDHNVLEPLAFGKAVTVIPDWNTTYPSYPVFHQLREKEALSIHSNARTLSIFWRHAVQRDQPATAHLGRCAAAISGSRGALEAHKLVLYSIGAKGA